MDTDERAADISVAHNLDGTSIAPPNISVGADPAVAPGADGALEPSAQEGEGAPPPEAGRELQSGKAHGMPGDSIPLETKKEPMEGVTPAPPAGPTDVLTKEGGAARLRKMLIGVTGGPLPSGDDKALENRQHHPRAHF